MDKGKTGTFDAEGLKHALMVLGDKLSEKEVDDLIGKYVSGGKIGYKKFSNELAEWLYEHSKFSLLIIYIL